MRTTRHQFEILVDYMERNGDISKLKMNPVGKARMSRHWEELSHLLNNSRNANGVAVVRTADQWRKVWSDFKQNIRKKAEKGKLSKITKGYFNNSIEARTIAIMNNERPTDTNSDAGDTDDTDVKCVAQVDVRKALNLLSDSDDEDLIISDEDREKELKIDFSIQNFSDQGYNLPDDDGFDSHEGYAEKNTEEEKVKSKNSKKKKSKEQKNQDKENENCSFNCKSKSFQQQNTPVASYTITDDVTSNKSKYYKKLQNEHDNEENSQTNVGNHISKFMDNRDVVKPETSDVIDLVQNNEGREICSEIATRKNGKMNGQKNEPLAETDDCVNNCKNNSVITKLQESNSESPRNYVSDNTLKDGSLRQLLLNKLQKKKLASQSQAFENDNRAHFNNAVGTSGVTDSVISVIPVKDSSFIDENNFADGGVSKETLVNNKRPASEQPQKPVQKRRRKVYSILMDKEREEKRFERELTMMKFQMMREEMQLKTRGLFMFQKFLHLAEQFFINSSVLK